MGPLGQLLPKREINADAFIANNPNCDGRGTLIAIWDTGIDPSAKGLQVTSDGRPKVIDFIDASGSGDVRMKSKQNISETGRTVKTLTGRQVFIPPHWKPVDGVIRIGVKPASELFPKVLLQRLRSEAKEILWKPCIRHLAANLASDLLEAENILTEHEIPRRSSEPSVGGGVCTVAVKSKGKGEPASEESAANENSKTTISRPTSAVPSDYKDTTDYKKQLAHVRSEAWLLERSLSTIDHNYEALDIIYDCFTFNDGSKWVACVDTSPYSRGRSLADMPLLADYTVDRQYACFGEETQLFYTVKIFNDGKLLQIVTNGSGHGTHVAAMSAAFFPSECEGCSDVRSGAASQPQLVRNGVAPGAQLVSIKISDSRLGGMETGISLLRAIRWTVELGCDVVNYSFGEYSVWPNIGRVSKHLIEMINAHGVTMVCSGGNNGPGLGTVGAPGGVVDGIIGVAPLVFPEMMCTLYCQPTDSLNYFNSQSTGVPNAKDNGTNHSYTATVPAPNNVDSQGPEKQVAAHTTAYTWGSRGPALDGSLGLCVAAPGAANTSTSSWQLRPAALLNGSSMSSPLVAGSIALIISGLRGKFGQISNSQNENNGPCKIPPCLIRLALTNTACPVKHLSLLDQGSGVIRVDKAFEYILNSIQWAQSQLSAQNLTLDTEGQFKDVTKKAKIANLQVTKDVTANSESVETQFPTLSTSCSLSAYYGWRVRCTVSGPGCYIKSRGIWLRQGCPHVGTERTNSSSEQLKLPLLRYTLLIKIDFDKCVPLEMRRNMELHLRMSVVSYTKEIKGGGVEVKTENEKPPWLQVAPFVSVTGTPREIKLCLDPNQIPCFRCRYERRQLSNSKPESETAEAHAISSYPCENQMSTSSPACVASSSVAHLNHSPPIFQSTETHLTMLNFTDPSYPTLGVLAQVPIILQDPIRLPPAFSKDHPRIFLSDNFDAIHKVRRWFVRIPSGASAGVLKLVRLDDNAPDCDFKVTICLPQLRSGLSTGQQEVTWPSFNLARCIGNGGFSALPNSLNTESTKLVFPIGWESDYMELTIAQNWGLEAPAVVFGELAFHGLEPNLHELALQTSSRYTRLMLRSNFTTEEIWPTIALTHWNLPLRPTTSKIFYLGQNKNEALLTGRGCYALRLLYEFSCPYKTSTVNIMLPWLQELLYDSDYVLQIYHLYDWRGKFIGAADYDSKWPKSSKCSFPVEKGDYKVLFQICHETGPNLTTEKIKQESSFVDDQATRKTGGSATTTSTSTGGDALSPLERLRNHPAIVRFTLPTTGNLNVPSDRRESCSVLTNPPVTFEFAVFPFSLGLNGSKPCSALDPIPYREFADTFPSSVQSREIDFVEANEELGCDQAAKPGELNRHCPHLPRSLGPGECTALYVGLTDERYPTYAVSGSYFSGSIGFYKSELLHSTITYPFRLIMDGDSAEKPAAAEVGHSTNVLTVGNLGLSAEDFNWLHPMTQLITGQSPPDGKVDEYSDHQKSTASQSPPLIADQAFKTKDPDKSPGQTKQAMNGADLAKSSSTDEKGEKEPESQSLATPPMNDKQPPVDLSSSERSYASPTLLDDNNLIPTIKDACQSLGNLEDNTANIPQLAPQPLSDRFVCAHNRLLDLDKPYSFNDKPNPQAREELWSAVDDLFVGHSVRHVVTDSNQPDVSGGLDRDCLLYHLLTMRLVRSQTKTSNMGSSSGKAGNASADDSATDPNLSATSETKIPTTQSETDLTKAAKNEGDDSLSKQSLDPTKRPSAKPADEKPGGISEKPQPSKSTSGTTYNYLELKLRTIDTLARYGRLLCERIILTDLLGADPNTEHETASHADSTGRRNSWSLLDVVDERALPSGCEPSHSECGQLLDRIHARLVELTSSAPSVSNSVGEHVRVGAHAIPSWLLASGYSKHSPGHPKHCDLEQNSWQCGSVGGRLVIFFLLYSLAKHQYPHALRLLTRILYQVKEPPTNSLSGPVSCGPTPSLGQLRRVVASQTGSLQTSKMGFPWLLWVLRRLNWTALEYQLKQNAPVLFPECDYTLMGDQ